MKSIGRVILSIVLCITLCLCILHEVSGAEESAGNISDKLKTVLAKYPVGSYWNSSFDGGRECYGFAKLVVYELFGKYSTSRYRSWNYKGVSTSGMIKIGEISTCTSESVQNLLNKAMPGDVLQFDYAKQEGHQHSMIIFSVTQDGAEIYECNFYQDGGKKNKITKKTLSSSEIAARQGTTRGKLTLLHSNNYPDIIVTVPELTSVKFDVDSITVNENVGITAVTSTDAEKLCLYSGSSLVKTWTEGFTDSGSSRTWKVTYAFSGTGERTVTFKAGNATGLSEGTDASISVKKVTGDYSLDWSFENKIAYIRDKIPNGWYWNHWSSSQISSLGITQKEVTINGTKITISNKPCNAHNGKVLTTCTTFDGGSQCVGFSRLLYKLVWGTSYKSSYQLSYKEESSFLDYLKKGDILYFAHGSGMHNVFVTNVNHETGNITFADCNWNGGTKYCVIRWNATWSKTKFLDYIKASENKNGRIYSYSKITKSQTDTDPLPNEEYTDEYVVVYGSGLHMRKEAGTSSASVTIMSKGTHFWVSLENTKVANGYTWANACLSDNITKGWVAISEPSYCKCVSQKVEIPTLTSVKFDAESAIVNEDVGITAVTSADAEKLCMYVGTSLIKTWTEGYTDSGSSRTWTVAYAFSGKGERTVTFKAGNSAGMSEGVDTTILVVPPVVIPTLSSVKFDAESVIVNEDAGITAVTSTDAEELCMYVGGSLITTWIEGYMDSGSSRTWKVNYAFNGKGERTVTFKAGNSAGLCEGLDATISVVTLPKLTSAKFDAETATVNEETGITAVTSTDTEKLSMYAESLLITSWTDGYTDNGSSRTWKVTYAFSGKGDWTTTFKAENNAGQSEGLNAAIKIVPPIVIPTVKSARFSAETATENEEITITVVTSADAEKLSMYADDALLQTWTEGYMDSGSSRLWKETYSFTDAGEKRVLFITENSAGQSEGVEAAISIQAAILPPTLSSVVFDAETIIVNETATITAVTSTNAEKLRMYSGDMLVKTWSEGYTDSDLERTWEVTYTFNEEGEKKYTFSAFNTAGLSEGTEASIIVTKAAELPTMASVQLSTDSAEVAEEITIHAVTSLDTDELCLYEGETLLETWTEEYTDTDSERVWEIPYFFSEAGNRTLIFKARNADGLSEGKKVALTVTNSSEGIEAPTISMIDFATETVTVNEEVTITAETSTDAEKLLMYEGNTLLEAWTDDYSDDGENRIWEVSYAFSETGERDIIFKAGNSDGISDGINATITVISAATVPSLSCIDLEMNVVETNQAITITAETSTDANTLEMYDDGILCETWMTGYTDEEETRIWTVIHAFIEAGERILTFRAVNEIGSSEETDVSLTVTEPEPVLAIPTLGTAFFTEDTAEVKEKVGIVVETSADADELYLYSGKTLVKTWTEEYTDNGETRTWVVGYAFSGKGKRTMTFKAGNAAGISDGLNATITIVAAVPTLTSVQFDDPSVALKQDASITAVTSTNTTKLSMYSGSSLVKTWTSGYTDNGSLRTWKVKYAFNGKGKRTLTFKAGNASGMSAAKKATITVTAALTAPTLSSVKFSTSSVVLKKNATITAVTSTTATKLCMYSENGKLAKAWTTGYIDSGTTRTWKVTFAFSGKGKRNMTFKAGNASGMSTGKNAIITVTAAAAVPTLNSVKFSADSVAVKKNVTITAVTSTSATKLCMYSEDNNCAGTWTEGYTDSGTTRTWKVTYAFNGKGKRTMTFKAENASGASTGKDLAITVTAANVPTLSSVKLSVTKVKVGTSMTFTVVTSTNTTKLKMFSGSTLVKAWTNGYTDSSSNRTWKVKYAFVSAGNRTVTFKAENAAGTSAGKNVTINVTK